MKPMLWTPRTVQDTIALYAEWADTYDNEVGARGYRTPARVARALAEFADLRAPLLDYGCGTGLSGIALQQQGFTVIDGTDITPEMLAKAAALDLYRKTWLSTAGALSFGRGTYRTIAAIGVISLGAAPASLLEGLVAKLATGGILALSYNDPTLGESTYLDALDAEVASGRADVIHRDHGPHLDDVGMGSDVILLRRK